MEQANYPLDNYKLEHWAITMARHVSHLSKDPSTKVGSIIFDEKRRIVSAGYNGLPRGVEDTPDRLKHRALKHAMVRHAEQNAISFANASLEGATLVCTHPCCSQCAAAIIQAGIKHVTYPAGMRTPPLQPSWEESVKVARQMFAEAEHRVTIRYRTGVTTRQRFKFGDRILYIGHADNFDPRRDVVTLCSEAAPTS